MHGEVLRLDTRGIPEHKQRTVMAEDKHQIGQAMVGPKRIQAPDRQVEGAS